MTVITKEQMSDFAMLDINDIFLYTAGAEGTGTYTDLAIDRNGSISDNVALNPAGANRIRGIAAANISFGNFETMGRVPVDPLNVEAVEVSRGPNSSISGLGNPSGTVNQVTPARFNQILRNRGIIGLIIAPLRNEDDTLPIQWAHFAAVAVAFALWRPNIPRVGSDHGQSIRLAIAECRRRGCRRIGLAVQRTIMERVEQQWLAGFMLEHAEVSLRGMLVPLLADPWVESTFMMWFKAERPDVILTGGDYASVLLWFPLIDAAGNFEQDFRSPSAGEPCGSTGPGS